MTPDVHAAAIRALAFCRYAKITPLMLNILPKGRDELVSVHVTPADMVRMVGVPETRETDFGVYASATHDGIYFWAQSDEQGWAEAVQVSA